MATLIVLFSSAVGRLAIVLVLTGLALTFSAQLLAQEGGTGDVVSPAEAPALVPLTGIKQVVTGGAHTCALTTLGAVKCWGHDGFGQVGDAANADDKFLPVDVAGLSSGVQAISAGGSHTCALTTAGRVKCWGRDDGEQLGDGAGETHQATPVDIADTNTEFKAITAGGGHTCALTVAGQVKCWGLDATGQIGEGGDTLDKPVPMDVAGITEPVQAIAAGGQHTCALLTTGTVMCWGSDSEGQIGDGPGPAAPKHTPVNVSGLSNVATIAAGDFHTCAMTTTGAIYCWGNDAFGAIGDGPDISDKVTPVLVPGFTSGATALSAGGAHTCAVTVAGEVKCWGRDDFGQVGDGPDSTVKDTPVNVVGLSAGVVGIAAGGSHSCALTSQGGAKCWGADHNGHAGDGAHNQQKNVPVDVMTTTTCYQLNVASSGGALPSVTPATSPGCPTGHHLSGALLTLHAAPVAATRVKSWSAPVSALPGSTAVSFLMPSADVTVTVTYENCRNLTRTGAGGPPPVANPVNSPGCAANTYAAGESVLLSALPTPGTRVNAWSTPATGTVGSTTAYLAMPNTNVTVNVVYESCRTLTLTASGGAAPSASPVHSVGCPLNSYAQGDTLTLSAAPSSGTRVKAWAAPASGSAGATSASLTMPNANLSIQVTYEPCHTLGRTGTGGNAPIANPAYSPGCPADTFAAGESIVLSSVPNAGMRVNSWNGAEATPATGSQVNAIVMPNANATVSVIYESCFALVVSRSGEGEVPTTDPTVTHGCLTGGFVAGQVIVLGAQPASGWRVARWEGTTDNASTASVNTAIMGGSATNVRVVYEEIPSPPITYRISLPFVNR